SRLTPSLLARQQGEARRQLQRVRLTPALIERPLANARDRLAALSRLASQLHPERPLERGYAIVLSANGGALGTKAAAAKEAALDLKFRDGTLRVATAEAPAPVKRRKKPAAGGSESRQDDLFG
ncbi:MAG: exodeoxyribonuclease VII large subunit, partial [Erythrobacter sp.]